MLRFLILLGLMGLSREIGSTEEEKEDLYIGEKLANWQPTKDYEASEHGNIVDEFCNFIFQNCPALATTSGVPLKNMTTGRNDVGVVFIPIKLIEINEIDQSFSMQVDLRINWGLPKCAAWSGVVNLGPKASQRLNETASNGLLPETCFYSKSNIYVPLILHSNSVSDTYSITT